AVVGRVLASHLTPTAVEFDTAPLRLLLRFESIEDAVSQQASTASTMIRELGFAARALSGMEEAQLWASHGRSVWDGAGAIVKVTGLQTELPGILTLLNAVAGRDGYTAAGRAGLGVFLARISGEPDAQHRAIAELRQAIPAGRGSAVLLRGSADVKAR